MNEIPGLQQFAKQNALQNSYVDALVSYDKNLSNTPKGVKNIGTTTYDTTTSTQVDLQQLDAVMSAPSSLYTDVLGPDGQETLNQISSFAQKQFVQQFYEAYMAPVAAKDVINRLGEVTSVVSNVGAIFPVGVTGVISTDPVTTNTKWRAAYNYSFSVVELPKGNPNGQDISYTFRSVAFPPFRVHDIYDLNSSLDKITTKDVSESTEKYFDMQNLVYRQNQGTNRNPAFKAVNDNIQIVQYLLNRCFGIESTYMTEWDLSLYIQEGLCSYETKEDGNGGVQQVPRFITNLTYGLIEDSPIDLTGKESPQIIEEISTYASVNMAVSTKMSIDGLTTGIHCNESSYEISAYPLSKYWYPPRNGQNDELTRTYKQKNEETQEVETIQGYLNVPEFISSFFAYAESGNIYDKRITDKWYTALNYRGRSLQRSTKSLLDIIHYNDARNAILTGWLSTDAEGEYHIANATKSAHGDTINHAHKSNAYSYIPYWKLFYATPGDGMDEYDIFMQDIVSSDAPEISFLDVAYTVIGQFTSDNGPFNNFIQGKADECMDEYKDTISNDDFDFAGNFDDGFDSVGNLSFKVPIVGRITIPHTKLLNMFLKKDKQTKKAMSKADSAKGIAKQFETLSAPTTACQVDENNNPITHIEVDEHGNEFEVSDYAVPTDQNLTSNLSYGDGVANFSPMMYGGPHGRYFSPLTLEGYTQLGNDLLSKVPTMDPWYIYINNTANNLAASNYTKNYKTQNRSYADAVTALTLNERESLINGDVGFGIGTKVDNNKWVYYGAGFDYNDLSSAAGYTTHYSYRYSGWGRGYYSYTSWRVYDYGYRASWYHDNTYRGWLGQYRGYWNSTKYGYTGRNIKEDCTNFIPDEPITRKFKLIPVQTNYQDTSWAWTVWDTQQHIGHDDNFYKQDAVRVKNKQVGHCTNFIIVPNDIEAGTEWANGAYNTAYGANRNSWYSTLKSAYDNGTYETLVSIPIANKGNGDVKNSIGILCGVAKIVKSQVWTQRWECSLVWERHSRRCWWKRHYWYCAHWYWGWKNVLVDTYNLILQTDRIKYFLPFKNLINLAAQNALRTIETVRNKTVADTILRWTTTGEDNNNAGNSTWEHVTDGGVELFPLMSSFINRFGEYGSYKLPGRSYWTYTYAGSLLKTNGLFFGDIFDNFRNNGSTIRQCTGVRWYQKYRDLWTNISVVRKDEKRVWRYGTNSTDIGLPKQRGRDWWIEYNYYYSGGRWRTSKIDRYDAWDDNNWWRSDLYTRTSNQSRVLRHWANQYKNEPVYGAAVTNLTDRIQETFTAPAVLEYYKGTSLKRQFFAVTDVFDVYIDIATQQIAWLAELSAFVDKFITDASIVKLYENSTDPKIQAITTKAVNWLPDQNVMQGGNSPYHTVQDGPYNINPTEDLNYVEALEILITAFKGTGNTNTLKILVDNRRFKLIALLNHAKELKSAFGRDYKKSAVLESFSILIHNTKQLIQGVANKYGQTVETSCFTGNTYNNILFDTKNDIQIGESTYNILNNPAALVWAYLNVLYQNRKYWINLRMNKMAGSYWNLRGLERALTFILANNTAADDMQTAGRSLKDSDALTVQTRDIKFVQARKSFQELAFSEEVGPVYTGAIWTAVEYVNIPEPEASPKYDAMQQTYKGRKIVYVSEVYKYAYQPEDGLYYIVSEEISNKVKLLSESLNDLLSSIVGREYIVTELDIESVNTLGTRKYTGIVAGTEIRDIYENKITLTLTDGTATEFKDPDKPNINEVHTAFINDLVQYKKQLYDDLIKQYLIGIYIKWRPERVWTGTEEYDENGDWHTDPYQEELTAQGLTRTGKNLYGIEYTNEGVLKAGITFGVTEGFDMDMLLTNLPNMKNNTVMETLCAVKNGKDWWRIEIPSNVQLLKSLLNTNPKLVPAYNILPSVSGLTADEKVRDTKTALIGAASTLSPIKEPSADLLTANTANALGLQASDALQMFNILGE